MQNIKDKIEAVLFITGRSMTIEEIGQFCNIGSIGSVKEAMHALQKDYAQRPGSLEVFEEDGKYWLNIKKEFNHLSTKLLSAADLDVPTQATLALIAYKQPIHQSEIIKMRGNTAYDHIHTLKSMGFVVSEKAGRTRNLRLGQKFFDYFDVVEETLKQKLQDTFEKQEKLTTEINTSVKDETKMLETEKEESLLTEEERITEENIPFKKKKITRVRVETHIVTEVAPERIVEKNQKEVILNLNADDFGSKS